jgi:O-antigen ligase
MQAVAPRHLLALFGLGALAAVNLLVATRIANGPSSVAVLVALLPLGLIGIGALISSSRAVLVYAALGLGIVGGPAEGTLNGPLPLPGSFKVYLADVIVCMALGAWLAAWLSASPEKRPRWLRTPILGWPLVLLAITLVQAVVRGSEQYGTSLLSGPVRLLFYAGIAAAVFDLQPRSAFKWITAVFYAGTLWHFYGAVSRIASGTLVRDELATKLSTGGARVIALSTGMYLGGALVLALLNVDLAERTGRRFVHLVMAGLAAFGVLATFGRTHYLILGPLITVLLLGFGRMRRGVSTFVPLALPVLILVALLLPRTTPAFGQTLQDRLATNTGSDSSVGWRQASNGAIWDQQVKRAPLAGVGFGLGATFTFNHVRQKIGQDPHNGYMYLWAGGGILALGSFILLLGAFLRDAWRRFQLADGAERALVAWSISMVLILALNFATTPFLALPRVDLTLWIALLLPATVPPAGT